MTADLVARLEAYIAAREAMLGMDEVVNTCHSSGGSASISLTDLREAASALRSSGEAEAAGWVFQHDETGRMTFCPNDGVNTPEVFAEMNPRYALCGAAHLHPATPASAWRPKPESEGWYWHFDGAVMWMRYVYPRPGHNYLAVEDPEHPVTGKRHFRMTEKMGGYWIGPLPYPTPPTSTKGG